MTRTKPLPAFSRRRKLLAKPPAPKLRKGTKPLPQPSSPPATGPATTILQALVWPDPALCSEQDLYLRLSGPAGVSLDAPSVAFCEGAHLQFNTYFNLFNLGKWQGHCGLKSIGLQLAGKGRVELVIFLAAPDQSWRRLVNEVITLSDHCTQRVEIALPGQTPAQSLLFFELRSLSAGHLTWAAWDSRQAPRRCPDLVLAVTTFRREDAVAQTVARFEDFAKTTPIGQHLHMIVVDNGRSAGIENSAHVTAIENENLGGAGGFARGLLAAKDRGASHCLFMDDDAATPMQAIARSWAFLAYARDPGTAIAGAMISTRHAWALWENGALFDGACRPLYGGTDLRDPQQVFAMEYGTTPRQPHNFYGGWWYFAFPLAEVKHLPFPFFVRGDDVSFSLVHDFNIVTLPGVVSFQESFTEKDSPLTWYLDLRSHLAHHLSLPAMDIGRLRTLRIALWFWLRGLIAAHYETMAAVNLALEDVLRGPDFFAENADMAVRRAQLAALRKAEGWQDLPAPPKDRRWLNPHRAWLRAVMKLSLNGHLLPFFELFGNRVTLAADQRWNPRETWGAAQITYRNAASGKAYSTRHSKAQALRLGLRMARLIWRFWREYDALKPRWQSAYPRLTAPAFWQAALKLGPQSDAQHPEPPPAEIRAAKPIAPTAPQAPTPAPQATPTAPQAALAAQAAPKPPMVSPRNGFAHATAIPAPARITAPKAPHLTR